ncbi:outer membrane beta-barrel protein [Luteirhabdus pelagi]|uniref:outer membrane beta-barrel protein n=1 Tax=Luteirhabdus pelagi TaxID=2792783 RepID=UPI00193ABE26|nr:outer membrane beta-barrel protein [Luteirhabdus pelagi]
MIQNKLYSKCSSVVIAIFCFTSLVAQEVAQEKEDLPPLSFSVVGGLHYADYNFREDDVFDLEGTFNAYAGVALQYKISNTFGLYAELNFARTGSNFTSEDISNTNPDLPNFFGKDAIREYIINLPLLLSVQYNDRFDVKVGPNFFYPIDQDVSETLFVFTDKNDFENPNIGFLIDVGAYIITDFRVGLRYLVHTRNEITATIYSLHLSYDL